ncbi:MAG: hypothetical protein HY881_25020 [Deltaproteobacteria bacterium]|nr:hypothetical protein [Deltaproteobacteria bacterium]
MKLIGYARWFLLICLLAIPIASDAEDKAGESLSYAVPETQFTFQPVVEGTEVVHDFVILNRRPTVRLNRNFNSAFMGRSLKLSRKHSNRQSEDKVWWTSPVQVGGCFHIREEEESSE